MQTASMSLSSGQSINPTTNSAFSAPSMTPVPLRSSPLSSPPARLKARPIAASAFNTSAFTPTPTIQSQPATQQSFGTTMQPMQPIQPPLQLQARPPSQSSSGPNYNISLEPQAPTFPSYTPAYSSIPQAQQRPAMPAMPTMAPMPLKPTTAPPPGWNPQSQPMLTPTVKKSFDPMAAKSADWGDFDPLK
jgi:SCY1-like protein 2